MPETITITLCDCAENHVGMQKLGNFAQNGFVLDDLFRAAGWFKNLGAETELLDLNYPIENMSIYPEDEAYLLIVRKGVDFILEQNSVDDLFSELKDLEWDRKALMYGRVVNKNARHNLCFGEEAQEPDYEAGKGRVVSFESVPLLKEISDAMEDIIGEKCSDLVAEGNYYYDSTKCGISFHGDSERKKVIGIRLGETLPLVYQWFYNSNPIGEKIRFELNHGDIYFMSEKATGNDWKRKTIYTLRHAAGSDKYI